MKPTPPGWPRASSSLFYVGAAEAIDWLCKAFGFELRLRVPGPDGKIMHSELVFGDAVFMVSDVPRADRPTTRAPTELDGANTQKIFVYVDDIDAHFERARAAGAKILTEVTSQDYGEEYWTDRSYSCTDIGEHEWYFAERVRTGTPKK
jgi:uncharacterized glyoxalase superfamily protein PhnB